MGLGWKSNYGSGHGDDTIGSGIEGAWKPNPTTWDMGYLKVLFKYEWELTKSPAGAYIWLAMNVDDEDMVVDAQDPSKKHRPMMTTADLALKFDPAYAKIAKGFAADPVKFHDAFAKAWFKLTHRDMGPVTTYFGPEVPKEEFLWQDPIPKQTGYLITQRTSRN
jgi:catalase-peroxidase